MILAQYVIFDERMMTMKIVEPIRDKKKIDAMKRYLKGKNVRDYVLFVLGINSGLRISDLLNLQVGDVQGKERITLKEIKTGKMKDFPLSDSSRKIIDEYLKSSKLTTGPLFPSRKGGKPISRVQAHLILSGAAKAVGVKEPFSNHGMRKTFGLFCYQQGIDITRIQQLLNHSSPGITLRYIGITKMELDQVYINLNL
jgi:integrase